MPRSAVAPVVDIVVLFAAVLVESIGTNGASPGGAYPAWALIFPPLAVSVLAAGGVYRERLRRELLDEMRAIAGATAIAAMTATTLAVAVGVSGQPALHMVRVWLFSTVYLTAVRSGMLSTPFGPRRATRTLIVGAGVVGQLVAKRLAEHREVGLDPVGFLDDDPLPLGDGSLPLLGRMSDLSDVLARESIEHVVFAFSKTPSKAMLPLMDECERRGVRVTLVPRLFERLPHNVTLDYIGALPLISVHPNAPESLRFRMKYAFDRTAAAALLMLFSPLLLAVSAGVAVSVGRPLLFPQLRVGRNGKVFTMLKFRTMLRDDEGAGDLVPSVTVAPGGVEGADRRTRFGTFLRKTSLDELPQLLNVVRGDMSLVGPRPERPELAELFRDHVYRYGERQRLKSGITGWAQIHGLRGKTSLADRVEWDNWYIENCSPWLDLKILLGTARSFIGAPHAE